MENTNRLSEVRVILQRLRPGERALDMDDPLDPENAGRRTKLGGTPVWIQHENDETPTCPGCDQKMTFIAQIDSFDTEYDSVSEHDKQEYLFDDVGMIYVFYCFRDGEAAAVAQSY